MTHHHIKNYNKKTHEVFLKILQKYQETKGTPSSHRRTENMNLVFISPTGVTSSPLLILQYDF